MSNSLFQQVRMIASDVLHVPRSHISEACTPQHIDSWDSLQHVNLLLALEHQFGVEFHPDEISQMDSIGKIVDILSQKIVGQV